MFVVFIGPPGAGKGTQSKRLVSYLHVPHISTGDMLREARHQDTQSGRLVAERLARGQLVSDDVVMELVRQRLEQPDCQRGCLFDGFPRTLVQAEQLDQFLEDRGTPLALVIELKADEEELMRRMLDRARLEHRPDDTPQTIAHRMEVYRRQTFPLLEYYRQRGLLESIDGMGTADEVFAQIKAAIEKRRNQSGCPNENCSGEP